MEEIREAMKKTWEMLKAKGLFVAWNSYEEWLEKDKKDEDKIKENKISK